MASLPSATLSIFLSFRASPLDVHSSTGSLMNRSRAAWRKIHQKSDLGIYAEINGNDRLLLGAVLCGWLHCCCAAVSEEALGTKLGSYISLCMVLYNMRNVLSSGVLSPWRILLPACFPYLFFFFCVFVFARENSFSEHDTYVTRKQVSKRSVESQAPRADAPRGNKLGSSNEPSGTRGRDLWL